MAIAVVQKITGATEFDGTLSLVFASPVTAGNLIVVTQGTFRNQDNYSVNAPSDNLSNSYTLAADRRDSGNTPQIQIYYAFNVTGGSTTVSLSCGGFGAANTQIFGVAYEVSGMGVADSLVGAGTGGSNGNSPSCTTGATGSPEVFVVAATVGFRFNFDISAIAVNSFTPAFTEDIEQLSFSPNVIAGEMNSRIDNTGTASGAQACSWSVTCFAGQYGGGSAIAAFYSAPPVPEARLTQLSREVLEQDGTVFAQLTQLSRQVLYPFTCEAVGTEIRLTQLPIEVAYDYAALQPFVTGDGVNWITPKRTLT